MADEPKTDTKDGQPNPADPSPTPPAADPKQAPDGENKTEPEDITFTPEQQKKIDEIINDRIGSVKKKTSAELDAERAAKAELAAKLKDIEDAKTKAEEDAKQKEIEKAREKGEFEKAAKLNEELLRKDISQRDESIKTIATERDTLRAELEKERIDSKLLAAASARAINAAQVVKLLKDEYRISLDAKTNQVMVDGDADTSLETVVQAFLDKNPHLDKSAFAAKSGAGSAPSQQPQTQGTFRRSQYQDFSFYKEHQEEMDRAAAEDRVIDG